MNEINLLRTLRHPNIVRYIGTEISGTPLALNIFLEYVPGGSLKSLIAKFGKLIRELSQFCVFSKLTQFGKLFQELGELCQFCELS